MGKIIVQVLASKTLNGTINLKLYSEEIEAFLKKNIPKNAVIRIGTFKNDKTAEFLKQLNYEVEIIEQNWRILLELNKGMIDTSEIILIFQHNDISNMTVFYEYALETNKKVYKLVLN